MLPCVEQNQHPSPGDKVRYQELKIRDVRRMAFLGLACSAFVAVCYFARGFLGSVLGERFLWWAWGIGAVVPLLLVMCVWYLLSTPAQNAGFIRWAGKNLGQKLPPDFDWSLLDPADPDYNVPTISYLLRNKHGRNARRN